MNINEKYAKITLLQSKNINANVTMITVGLLGSVAGVIVAHKMGYKFWGKVGFYFLGAGVVGLPMHLIFANKIAERKSQINVMTGEIMKEEYDNAVDRQNKIAVDRQNKISASILTSTIK